MATSFHIAEATVKRKEPAVPGDCGSFASSRTSLPSNLGDDDTEKDNRDPHPARERELFPKHKKAEEENQRAIRSGK